VTKPRRKTFLAWLRTGIAIVAFGFLVLDDQKLHAFAVLPDVTISATLAICLAAVSLYLVFG
jgi:uncharacterized membrane protein YidH (DUF202 family)